MHAAGKHRGRYVPPRIYRQHVGVSEHQLRWWAKAGKIDFVRTPGGNRLYRLDDREDPEGDKAGPPKIAYCRVSSSKQRPDLERQQHFMAQRFPDFKIVSDVGSGINWKRPGLLAVLDGALDGSLKELAVANRDTGTVDSLSNSSNTCSGNTGSSSSSSTIMTPRPEKEGSSERNRTLLTTCCPSSKCFAAAETGGGDTPAAAAGLKTLKIKLNPTQRQKLKLRRFNDACRFTYNACVAAGREDDVAYALDPSRWRRTKLDLRNQFVTNTKKAIGDDEGAVAVAAAREATEFMTLHPWLKDTPNSVRQRAVGDYTAARKAAVSNVAAGHQRQFTMRFRNRKLEKAWTIGVDRAQIKFAKGKLTVLQDTLCSASHESQEGPRLADVSNHGCLPWRGSWKRRRGRRGRQKVVKATAPRDETRMRVYEKPPFDGKPANDCKIHYDGTGRYFLLVPVPASFEVPKDRMRRPAVGIDPGIRKMLTTYDTMGFGESLGVQQVDRLIGLWRYRESLEAQISKGHDLLGTHRARKRLRKIRMMYKNVKDDFHWQLAASLSKRHSAVFLAHPNLKEWTQTQKANGSVRLAASGLGLFIVRLKESCARRGTWLPDVDENYTTKTCSACGAVHWSIGSNETFACPYCPSIMDRDLNAAKNMLIKHNDYRQIWPAETARLFGRLRPWVLDSGGPCPPGRDA